MTQQPLKRLSRPVMVAIVAFVLAALPVLNNLVAFDWDATVFIGFGEDAVAITEYAEERLGEVHLREQQGHDGKFFYVQANDPFVLDPEVNASILAPPVYRSQRMFYPLLAGGFGVLGPEAIVWSLVIVNLVAMALGTLGTARLAQRLGGSPWWGLVFAGNLGLVFDLENDGAGIVTAALAMWAVLMLYEHRFALSIGFIVAAVLTREVMLVCALGIGMWHWQERRRRPAALSIGVPAVVFAVWAAYLRIRLGPDESDVGAFSLPFVGLARAIPGWFDETLVLAAGLSVLAIAALFVIRWASTRTALGWAFVGFVPLAFVLSEKVWGQIFDFARALAPLLTAAVLLIFVEYRRGVVPLHAPIGTENSPV